MPKRNLAKSSWVLGLTVILCTYNLAYANMKVSENRDTLPAKERINKSNDNGVENTSSKNPTTTTVLSGKRNGPTARKTTAAANACACSCSAKTGRAGPAPGAWWNCVKGCLRSWGVSPVQLALCGASCGVGVIPLCAFCVGIDVSLFILCSTGCAVYAGDLEITDEGHGPILVKQTPVNNRKKPERRVLAFADRK